MVHNITTLHVNQENMAIPLSKLHISLLILVTVKGNSTLKGAQSYLFNFFPNFWRFWYHKKAHIFIITHVKFHGLKVFCLEDIYEKGSDYGNHNN